MSHRTRVERHIIVDLIAGVVAASLVVAVLNRSWAAFLLTLASGLALFLIERNNISEEDKLEERPETFEVLETALSCPLNETDLKILRKASKDPASGHVSGESLKSYINGINDGRAASAQWILNAIGDSE